MLKRQIKMKVKLGKTYGDGSQDFTIEGMTHQMKENLIRLGMIKSIEDAVKQNADWFRDPAPEEPATCCACNGSGEGMYDGTRCRHCNGKGVEKRED
jgi:hypothetical protein